MSHKTEHRFWFTVVAVDAHGRTFQRGSGWCFGADEAAAVARVTQDATQRVPAGARVDVRHDHLCCDNEARKRAHFAPVERFACPDGAPCVEPECVAENRKRGVS